MAAISGDVIRAVVEENIGKGTRLPYLWICFGCRISIGLRRAMSDVVNVIERVDQEGE